MNLLARLKKLKSFIKPGLIALIPVFLGCDSATDAGTEFDLDTNIDVKLLEIDLPSTNVYLDSLRTDGRDRILIGSFNDPLTGNVTAESYFQYGYVSGTLPTSVATTANPLPLDTLQFDSLFLELVPNEFIPFLQSATLSFDVVELTDTLLNNVIYLSNKSEGFDRVIGSYEKTVNPINDSLYRVRLNDSFGLEFFNLVANVTRDSTQSLFTYLFKDWGIIPTTNSDGLALINAESISTQIKLYMSGDADSVYTSFFNIAGVNYSHLTRDRSTSVLNPIVEKEDFDIPGDGRTTLDPLAGLTTSFNIEGLVEFFDNNPNVLINTAIIDFNNGDFVSRDTLDFFRVYFRQDDGGIFGPAIALNSDQEQFSNIIMNDAAYISARSSPATALFNTETEKYSMNPTLFFQAIYNNYQVLNDLAYIEPFQRDTIYLSDMVLVYPSDVTTQQAIFSNSGIKLRVYYTEVN